MIVWLYVFEYEWYGCDLCGVDVDVEYVFDVVILFDVVWFGIEYVCDLVGVCECEFYVVL